MSKPLELIAYRQCPCSLNCPTYVHPDLEGPNIFEGNSEWHLSLPDKRLTDAELAAEYHAMDALLSYAADLPSYLTKQRHKRLETLHRFATHDHYGGE